jgi:hypothetical protein
MTEPEPERIQFMHGYPIPTRDNASLLASHRLLLEAAAECLPVRVMSRSATSYFEEWEVTRASFMARMASTLRHLSYLVPSYSRLDGLALARTLIDHVITFAWISGDPVERLPVFLRSSFSRTLDTDRTFRRMGETLLDEQRRRLLRAYVRRNQGDLPGLPRLSKEADESWREDVVAKLPASLQIPKFEELYTKIYDHYAASDHPNTLGLQTFVHLAGRPVVATVDGEPVRDRRADQGPYWIAVFAFAEALVVSNLASGRPRLQSLQRALGTIGTMRELERKGRLAVTVTDEGGVNIGVADDDGTEEASTP